MAVDAVSLAVVKTLLPIGDTSKDGVLTTLIGSVSREIEAHIGYELEQKQRTVYYDVPVRAEAFFLPTIPIVSVDEVKTADDGDFDGADALVVDQDYRLQGGRIGILTFIEDVLFLGPQRLRVKYTAGIATTTAGVESVAPDLSYAAALQVCQEYRRKDSPATISIPGSKGSRSVASEHGLLSRVREILGSYRRLTT